MNERILQKLKNNMSPTQAAALAVLVGDIRAGLGDVTEESQELKLWLINFEETAIQSIKANDGEVAQHIGHAARQMNPLLINQN